MSHFREKTALWNDLTDEQSEKLVGGVGRGDIGPGAGINGWGVGPSAGHGLISAGFTAPGVLNPNSAVRVTNPGPKA